MVLKRSFALYNPHVVIFYEVKDSIELSFIIFFVCRLKTDDNVLVSKVLQQARPQVFLVTHIIKVDGFRNPIR